MRGRPKLTPDPPETDSIPLWPGADPIDNPYDSYTIKADMLRQLSPEGRQAVIDRLSEEQRAALKYWWEVWARDNQLTPPGAWLVWLIMAGRGFGKTRTLCEKVRERQEKGGCGRIAIIGATADDVRAVMVEGESGILAVSPPWNKPKYEPSKRRLTWPNGAMAFTYSADEPDRLRGPQHDFAACDELAAWKYAQESFDMMMFGMRLGTNPQVGIATTPRPIPILKDLIKQKTTVITKGSTYDNKRNLPDFYLNHILTKYEGTRLGRQEIHAKLLEDTPGALWTAELLEATRVRAAGKLWGLIPNLSTGAELYRIVIGLDPAGRIGDMARVSAGLTIATQEQKGDEAGIVICGKGDDEQGYVLEDRTTEGSPLTWGNTTIDAYMEYGADAIAVEYNHGGEEAIKVLQTLANNRGVTINIIRVWASKGKHTRAEPISSLYEQHLIHHVGEHEKLEDELTGWVPGQKSPNRLDAAVFALTEMMVGDGFAGGAVLGGERNIEVPMF